MVKARDNVKKLNTEAGQLRDELRKAKIELRVQKTLAKVQDAEQKASAKIEEVENDFRKKRGPISRPLFSASSSVGSSNVA